MDYFVKKIIRGMFNTLKHKKLCMLGVAFKQGTNDARNSPALYVCMKLLIEGATIKVYDAKVERTYFINEMKWKYPDFKVPEDRIMFCNNAYNAMEDSSAVVICTEWDEFKSIDYVRGFDLMKQPAYCFDGRLLINRDELEEIGFIVETIGF